MQSFEPFEPSVSKAIPPVAPPMSESEEWRADIASRVQSYRTRQKNRPAEQQSLGFPAQHASTADGGSKSQVQQRAEVEAQTAEAQAPRTVPAETVAAQHAGANIPEANILRGRLSRRKPNESLPGAFDTNYYRRLNALALEDCVQASNAAAARVCEPTAHDAAVQELGAESPQACSTARPLPMDFELHSPAAGDACLDRYRINEDEKAAARSPQQGDHALPANPSASAAAPQTEDPQSERIAPLPAVALESAPVSAAATHGNLIVFPRPLLEPPLWSQPSRDELADPVSRPRILDVPEEIMPAVQGSLFPEIRLDLEEPEPSVRREREIEVTLPVAPLSARLKAAMADTTVVGIGGGLFAAIAGRAMPELDSKPFSAVVAIATLLLWAAYQQMFLLYAGRTVGMRAMGLRLSTFDGRAPQWNERRSRARYVLISCASAALGFLWALLDEDRLCWHDRASRTFPTME